MNDDIEALRGHQNLLGIEQVLRRIGVVPTKQVVHGCERRSCRSLSLFSNPGLELSN